MDIDVVFEYIKEKEAHYNLSGWDVTIETFYEQRLENNFFDTVSSYLDTLTLSTSIKLDYEEYDETYHPATVAIEREKGIRINYSGDKTIFSDIVLHIKELGYATPDDFHIPVDLWHPVRAIYSYFSANSILEKLAVEKHKELREQEYSQESKTLYEKYNVCWN